MFHIRKISNKNSKLTPILTTPKHQSNPDNSIPFEYDPKIPTAKPTIQHNSKIKRKKQSHRNSIVLDDQFDKQKLRIELKPIRVLGEDIKRRLSKNSFFMIENQDQGKENTEPRYMEKLPNLDLKMIRKSQGDHAKIQVRVGQHKINSTISLYLSNKLLFPQQELSQSYLYFISVHSGMVQGKSQMFPFETINESQIVIKYNRKMMKNTFSLSFYKVKLPNSNNNRIKLGYIMMEIPNIKDKNYSSSDKQITLSSKLWNDKDEFLHEVKIYLKVGPSI